MTDAEAALTRSLAEALRLSSQAGELLAGEVRGLREAMERLDKGFGEHRRTTEPALRAYEEHLAALQREASREVAQAAARQEAAEKTAAAAQAEANAARAAGRAKLLAAVERYGVPILIGAIAYLAGTQGLGGAPAQTPDTQGEVEVHAEP